MPSKITITKPDVHELKGVSAKNNKPYLLRIQTGYLHAIDADGAIAEIPDKFEFFLEDGAQPYARGQYHLSDSAVSVGRDGRLSVTTRLVPITPSGKA